MRGSGLSDYIIAIVELFEAEGRVLKKQALRFAYSLGFLLTGILILLMSIGYVLWAFNGFLSDVYGQNLASVLTAIMGLSISTVFLGLARWLNR